MATRGSIAKQEVINKIKAAFGENYVGENASKHYVWANDGGEKVQIAISLTCPKVPLGNSVNADEPVITVSEPAPAEITEEEQQNLREMMKRLGL